MSSKKLPSAIPRNGLVGEWLLDGTALDTNDGTKNNGTATNVTYANTDRGYQKQLAVMNGTTSVISAPYSNLYNFTDSSIFGWCFFPVLSHTTNHLMASRDLISAGNRYWQIYVLQNTGALGCAIFNTSNTVFSFQNSDNFLGANKWYFVGMTISGSTVKLFLDGNEISGGGTFTGTLKTGTSVGIGIGSTSVPAHNYKGNIQSVRIYNRAISTQEIQILYQEGLRQLGAGSDNLLSSAVAYYDFNGDANDVIGGNNGAVTGATLTTDRFGVANRAYNFDGNVDHITTGFTTALGIGDWSFETLIYLNNIGTDDAIFFKLSGTDYMVLSMEGNDPTKIEFVTATGGQTSRIISPTGYVSAGNWYHLVGTISSSGTILNIYKDGENNVNGTVVARNMTGTTAMTLSRNNATACLDGKMAFARIYNRTLSASEVKELYNLSRTKYLYPFKKTLPQNLMNGCTLHLTGDNTTTTLHDITGNGDATISSTPVINRIMQHKTIKLSSQSITWSSRTLGTTTCWELVSGKWVLQINPAFITATGITSTTKDLANIMIWNRVLTINEQQQIRFSQFLN